MRRNAADHGARAVELEGFPGSLLAQYLASEMLTPQQPLEEAAQAAGRVHFGDQDPGW